MDDTENDYPWRYDPIPRRDVQLPPREPEATRIAERERDEDQGVIRVWRRRCEEAEARADRLASELADLRAEVKRLQEALADLCAEYADPHNASEGPAYRKACTTLARAVNGEGT